MAHKVLVFLRVSTEAQELEEQRKEMIEFVQLYGYTLDDIIFIEDKGASAIKLNEKYLDMIDDIASYIESGEIDCVAVWAVNRLARNEVMFAQIKSKLVENKIQLLVKTPTLQLLNPDGTINSGSELALSLFSTMAQQEMLERKSKFKRTKRAYAPKGMYTGGTARRFGYKVENKYFVPCEVDGESVKLMFELYSTGKYSFYKLAGELNIRGIEKKHGKGKFTAAFVGDIISSPAYYGEVMEQWNNRVYPPLISKELFDKCAEIREKNKIEMRVKDVNDKPLAARLIRCTECGHKFLSSGALYKCSMHNIKESKYCPNSISVQKKLVDALVWRVASAVHLEFLWSMSDEKLEEYTREVEIIDMKINTITNNINGVQKKKQRIIDTFLEGLIDKENRDLKLSKISEEVATYQKELNSLNETKNSLIKLIESYQKKDEVESFISSMDTLNALDKYDVIHQQLKEVTFERYKMEFEGKIFDNATLITITTITGGVWKFCYLRYAKKIPVYVWNGSEWMPDYAE